MASAPQSADNSLLISRSAANETFRDALRMFVGRGKRYSVKQLSNGCGIKDRMIESFMAPVDSAEWRKPDLEEVLSIASFIGPDFTTELLEPAQQGAFWLPDADDTPPGAMAADASEDTAKVVRAAIDGTFDATEKPELKVVGRRMMQRGASLAALAAA
jgi:hypothetical protein